VLEGSVRRDAERVCITAHLIQVADQARLWSGQYDRELRSVLVVQDEIARAVAEQIRVTLTDRGGPGPRAVEPFSPRDYAAYDLYPRAAISGTSARPTACSGRSSASSRQRRPRPPTPGPTADWPTPTC